MASLHLYRSFRAAGSFPYRALPTVLAVLAFFVLPGCDGSEPTTPASDRQSSTIQLSASLLELVAPGDTGRLQLLQGGGATQVVLQQGITWTAEDSSVAAVDGRGLVRARKAGETSVVASSKLGTFSAHVKVGSPNRLISITPSTDTTGVVGDTVRLVATVTNRGGIVVSNRDVEWRSLDPSVATVDSSGVVITQSVGEARITAANRVDADTALVVILGTADDVAEIGTVAITPSESTLDATQDTVKLAATVRDEEGDKVSDADITWKSLDTDVATVNSVGRVVSRAAGVALITATSGGVMDTATVEVQKTDAPVVVASVEVSPEQASIEIDENTQLEATALDEDGNTLTDAVFTWSSSDPAVAEVDEEGVVRGVASGSATITANSDGESGTSEITVMAPESEPEPDPTPPSGGEGIWISPDEIASLPTSGEAWDNVKVAADRFDPNTLCLSHNSRDDVEILAASYVAVRLNNSSYYRKVAEGLENVIGKEDDGTHCGGDKLNSLSLHRNLAAYVIAADVIDYKNYDSAAEPAFRDWVKRMRDYEHPEGGGCSPGKNCSTRSKHENRPNNHGTLAGASRIAANLYLGDEADLDKAVAVFKGFLGDRSSYAGFIFQTSSSQDSRTWSPTPTALVPINPKGATVEWNGRSYNVDGAIIDDFSRGCATFQWEPCHTGYPWEGLAGLIVQAEMLYRQGYPVYDWEDQAIRRAYEYLLYLHNEVGYWFDEGTISGDENWQPWIANKRYGTTLPTRTPTTPGKGMGWADWTHRY